MKAIWATRAEQYPEIDVVDINLARIDVRLQYQRPAVWVSGDNFQNILCAKNYYRESYFSYKCGSDLDILGSHLCQTLRCFVRCEIMIINWATSRFSLFEKGKRESFTPGRKSEIWMDGVRIYLVDPYNYTLGVFLIVWFVFYVEKGNSFFQIHFLSYSLC